MKKMQISLPCSPSKRIEHNTKKVKEVLVSWGGGMGGSNQTYYGDIKEGEKGFIILTDYNGKEIELNKAFIVHKKDKQLLTTIVDVTNHANYQEHTVNKRITTTVTVHEPEVEFELLNVYKSDTNLNKIETITEDS